MEIDQLLLQLLIGIAAIGFGIFTGRAKAERLRSLYREVSAGRIQALAIVGVVALLSLYVVLTASR